MVSGMTSADHPDGLMVRWQTWCGAMVSGTIGRGVVVDVSGHCAALYSVHCTTVHSVQVYQDIGTVFAVRDGLPV